MGTLSARNLTQALSQARNIGLVEEPFVVSGVSVIVRNLRPDQYESIFKECQNLADVEYLNAWQLGHVSRAICEVNGVDFRDVKIVEDEESDPKRPGQVRTVKVELHTWLLKNLLSTWSRETLYICYRKVADAIEAGEKLAQDGITFRTADETPEDKYRRLIGELKEIEDEVPEKVMDGILRDNGFVRRATVDEIEAVQSKLAQVPKAEEPPVVEEPPVAETPPEPPPAPKAAPAPPSADRIAQLLRNRVPLNQPLNPIVAAPEPAPVVLPEPQQPVQQPPVLRGRSAELAAIEGQMGEMEAPPVGAINLQPQGQVPEVRLGAGTRVDPDAAKAIIDTPPVGGINPRFRPPTL